MEKFKPKNRQMEAINKVALWCFIISILLLYVWIKAIRVKENYTNLHHRVNYIERMVNKCIR